MADRVASTLARDRSERFGGALVHHGPVSDRAYLAKPGPDPAADIRVLERLAAEHGYGKLFATVRAGAREVFEAAGFVVEARVPLACGSDELLFFSRFLDPERAVERHGEGEVASGASGTTREPVLPPGLELRVAGPDDAADVASLYDAVFESYPFPISSPAYVAEAMEAGTVFVLVTAAERIVAAASAEIDEATCSCEMTDFATLPDQRGRGLALVLLGRLEEEARARGVTTAYTIARARSAGMTAVFTRRGYAHGGVLLNNTGICGAIESMNVWHRRLDG
ncbi:MAG: putative beta-lysine N-acetyltransferase [Anaerosomatales bacterium]|nr:putative beta-lysine N-acetyltransferase [Anaerosomatales bacterium]